MSTAKERPILFSEPMVQALLAGRKTQTRRIMKLVNAAKDTDFDFTDPDYPAGGMECIEVVGGTAFFHIQTAVDDSHGVPVRCPYGEPGDRLWVRETWSLAKWWPEYEDGYPCGGGEFEDWTKPAPKEKPAGLTIGYRADGYWAGYDTREERGFRWRSPRFMPRWASRITLELADVRVERVQQISEEDAKAEGIERPVEQIVKPGSVPIEYLECLHRDYFAMLWDVINGPGSWDLNPWVWVLDFKVVPRPEPGTVPEFPSLEAR